MTYCSTIVAGEGLSTSDLTVIGITGLCVGLISHANRKPST